MSCGHHRDVHYVFDANWYAATHVLFTTINAVDWGLGVPAIL